MGEGQMSERMRDERIRGRGLLLLWRRREMREEVGYYRCGVKGKRGEWVL